MTRFNTIYNAQGADTTRDKLATAIAEVLGQIDIEAFVESAAKRSRYYDAQELRFIATKEGAEQAIDAMGLRDVAEYARDVEDQINISIQKGDL